MSLSQDKCMSGVLQYLLSDKKSKSDSSESVSHTINFHDLTQEYQSCLCLNLNSCVSDDLLQKIAVVNKYLHDLHLTKVKDDLEKYALERRKALDLKNRR